MATTNVAPLTLGQITDDTRWNERNGLMPGIGEPTFYTVSGANPAAGLGVNGDFAFRYDGAAGTTIFQKRAGAWVEVTSTLGATTITGALSITGTFTETGHFVSAGTAPTAAAGGNAGGSPPAPVVTAGDTDARGNITFGTGTVPAAGAMVVVTFNAAFVSAPLGVILTWANVAGAGLGQAYVTAISTTQFTINCTVAPAASQANTTYSINYWVIG